MTKVTSTAGTEATSPVKDEGELRRLVALAVAAAESILNRPIETVLDIGCGEGRWQPILQNRALAPATSASIPASMRSNDGAQNETCGSGALRRWRISTMKTRSIW